MPRGIAEMKIGYLSPAWPPGAAPNGIVASVAAVKAGLESQNHRAHVFARELAEEDRDPTIHPITPRRVFASRVVNGVSRRLTGDGRRLNPLMEGIRGQVCELHRRGEIDILEMEETWGGPLHLAGRIPVPVVVRLHGPWFLNGTANGANHTDYWYDERVRRERTGIAAADAVSAPSLNVIQQTRQYYQLPLCEAEVIPNPLTGSGEPSWSDSDCQPGTILFVGRFDRHKGGDVVLRAFGSLAKRNGEAKLTFCGPDRGLVDDQGIKRSLDEFLRELSLPDSIRSRIEFVGAQPPRRVAELRRQAAVTVMASRWENFANTVLEAFAIGSPLVATASGGTPEIVRDGVTGLLVPPNDPEAMADAILLLLERRELASRLAAAAQRDAHARFSAEPIVAEHVHFYERVIDRFLSRRRGAS